LNGGSSLELPRRLLHLLDRVRGRGSIGFEQLSHAPRAVRELLDDRVRLEPQTVQQRRAGRRKKQQHQGRADGSWNAVPLHPADRRIEGVAGEHAEHDRDHHALCVLQHEHNGENGEHRQRRAPDVDCGTNGGRRLFVC
jgi:hypothetical protein